MLAPPHSLHWLLLRACWQMLAPSRAPRDPPAWTRPCLLSVGGRPSAAPRGLVRGSSSSEPCIKSVGAGAAGCAGSSSGESTASCQLLFFPCLLLAFYGFVRESVKEVLPCLPATLCSRIIVSSTFAPFCLHCRSRITEVPSHAPFEFAKRCYSSTQPAVTLHPRRQAAGEPGGTKVWACACFAAHKSTRLPASSRQRKLFGIYSKLRCATDRDVKLTV